MQEGLLSLALVILFVQQKSLSPDSCCLGKHKTCLELSYQVHVVSSNAQHEYFDKSIILPHEIADASIAKFLSCVIYSPPKRYHQLEFHTYPVRTETLAELRITMRHGIP